MESAPDVEKVVKQHGEEGWRLVQILIVQYSACINVIFEREINH